MTSKLTMIRRVSCGSYVLPMLSIVSICNLAIGVALVARGVGSVYGRR